MIQDGGAKMTNNLQTKDNAEQNLTQEMLPLVSVIMPVYNGAKYIGQAISSVYAQKCLWN